MNVQPDWIACRFDRVPIFALGLDMDLSLRLYGAGFRTAGDLDVLIGDYREKELFALIGPSRGRKVIARLLDFCRRRLLEQIRRRHLHDGRDDG